MLLYDYGRLTTLVATAMEYHQRDVVLKFPIPRSIKICPTLDIVAVVTSTNVLEVFRSNGQHAFVWAPESACQKVEQRSETISISHVAWREDGLVIAVALSNGSIQTIDISTGKLISQVRSRVEVSSAPGSGDTSSQSKSAINVGWGCNLIQFEKNNVTFNSLHGTVDETWSIDWGPRQGVGPLSLVGNEKDSLTDSHNLLPRSNSVQLSTSGELSLSSELPHQLATMDIECELPRLSALPRVEENLALEDVKTDRLVSQDQVDSIFSAEENYHSRRNAVDLLVCVDSDGQISSVMEDLLYEHARSVDTTSTTTTAAPSAKEGVIKLPNFALHATHHHSNIHSFVTETESEDGTRRHVFLEMISFNALRRSGHYLNLLIPKVEHLVHLSHYIRYCTVAIRSAWAASQDLPARFVDTIRSSLAESINIDIDTAFYHQVFTGDIFTPVHDWLKDQLQERGHKRWDNAVVTGYHQIITLTHTYLLPALERLTAVVSRLRAISRRVPSLSLFTVDQRHLTRILGDIDVLRLIGHHVLRYASHELKLFRAFSAWLGLQIVIAKADGPQSASYNDAMEKTATCDLEAVLAYIKGPMINSHLGFFLGRHTVDIIEAPRRAQLQVKRPILLQILERHRRVCVQPQPSGEGKQVEVVNILLQSLYVNDSINVVAEAVKSGWKRESTSSGRFLLDTQPSQSVRGKEPVIMDSHMVLENSSTVMMCTYVATAPHTSPAQVILHRALHHSFVDTVQEHPHKVAIASQLTGSLSSAFSISHPAPLSSEVPGQSAATQAKIQSIRFLSNSSLLLFIRREHPQGVSSELWTLFGGTIETTNTRYDANQTSPLLSDSDPMQVWHPIWQRLASFDHTPENFLPDGVVDARLSSEVDAIPSKAAQFNSHSAQPPVPLRVIIALSGTALYTSARDKRGTTASRRSIIRILDVNADWARDEAQDVRVTTSGCFGASMYERVSNTTQ